MPTINLLPWREERRQERQRQFNFIAAGAAVLGAGVVFYANMTVGHFVAYQNARNQYLQSQIAVIDGRIKEIKDLRSTKERLLARMQIIEELQKSRPEEVHLFDALAKTVPDGVYLTSIKQAQSTITMQGVAESSARVSAYMRNIAGSHWLGDPDLTVVEKSSKSKTGLRRQTFTVSAKVLGEQTDATEDSAP
jgi:type IV pilus assembly protein PilN